MVNTIGKKTSSPKQNPCEPNQTKNDHDLAVDAFQQPLLEHLLELRKRILTSLCAVVALFIPFFFYSNELYSWVAQPLVEQLPQGASMIATQVATPFFTPLKLAIFAAIFAGVPIWLHQLWAFISPGLYRHEKRFAIPLLISSVLLFYSGMMFVHWVVFPLIFNFFVTAGPQGVAMMTDIDAYLNFILKMYLAFGLAFEIPMATLLLVLSGITTPQSLEQKRPWLIVGCFVLGMLLTPPDIISQVLLAIPAWMLFEIGLLLARLMTHDSKQEPTA